MAMGWEKTRIEEEGTGLYHQDDILRGLRASLVAVLSAALASGDTSYDFVRGILTFVRSQAALYGIPWCDLVSSLRDVPELWSLARRLQDGAVAYLERHAQTVGND